MVATRLRFVSSGTGQFYIDIAKALSLQNRKLHRQKMIYNIYGGYFVDSAGEAAASRFNINTAPNTWVSRRAVNRGFAIWRRMIAETLANSNGVQSGKWNDFHVLLNQQHGASPLLPLDAAGNNQWTGSAGEWDYSVLTTDDPEEDASGIKHPPDQFQLMIVGPHTQGAGYGTNTSGDNYTRVGLIQSWFDSRPTLDGSGTPVYEDEPTTKSDPLANMFDKGDTDDDRMEKVMSEGDQPPYDEETALGNAAAYSSTANLQRQCTTFTTAQTPLGAVMGFRALCGLIQVDVVAATGAWELVLDVESVGVKF